jgi:Sec-independent protein translocase protein TatA
VGFGTEILFLIVLGALLLGPKQLHAVLGHIARAKAQFEKANRSLKSQLEAELEAQHPEGKTVPSEELAGEQ